MGMGSTDPGYLCPLCHEPVLDGSAYSLDDVGAPVCVNCWPKACNLVRVKRAVVLKWVLLAQRPNGAPLLEWRQELGILMRLGDFLGFLVEARVAD